MSTAKGSSLIESGFDIKTLLNMDGGLTRVEHQAKPGGMAEAALKAVMAAVGKSSHAQEVAAVAGGKLPNSIGASLA